MDREIEIEAKISCVIERVVACKQGHFFVLVQLKCNDDVGRKSTKFRTETYILSNRPSFKRNYFTFFLGEGSHTFKFGLMLAKSQLDSDATSAMVFGVCSLPITRQRLMEQPDKKFDSEMVFSDRGKQVGRFTVKINSLQFQKKVEGQNTVKYNPFISRVLYQEECTDRLQLQSNMKTLEQQLMTIHKELQEQKKEQNYFEKIYFDLEEDQKQLKTQIDYLETMNSKIDHRLHDRESAENLKIQIDMLGQSQEGKKVLLDRLSYFQDRINRELEENQKLVKQYEKIRPELQANLEKAERHAEKLKGKQLQEFELEKNKDLLKKYDDLMYEFKCNEEAIKSLSKMSGKSQFTAQQAKFLLSQVSYQVKLAEYGQVPDKANQRLLREIQKAAKADKNKEQEISEEEEMVYRIKLSAIKQQIQDVRAKIKQSAKRIDYI